MISWEINFCCDGPKLLKRDIGGCQAVFCEGVWKHAEEFEKAWVIARAAGWHVLHVRCKQRHLCPTCWDKFMEGEK